MTETIAIQKLGIDTPTSATPITAESIQVLRLHAASMPSATPTGIVIAS